MVAVAVVIALMVITFDVEMEDHLMVVEREKILVAQSVQNFPFAEYTALADDCQSNVLNDLGIFPIGPLHYSNRLFV